MLLPLLAGWCVGFFLREVQATVIPYHVFLVLGSLAGQLQFIPPQRILIGSEVGLIALWIGWSWLVHRRSGHSLAESLQKDALSYLPLLLLPGIALLVERPSLQGLAYGLDPLIIVIIATVGAIKAWQWNAGSLSLPPSRSETYGHWVWILFLIAAITFAVLGILQYHSWNVPIVDTGLHEELFWNTLHGRFLFVASRVETVFTNHVMLTELLWFPLYALWPSLNLLTIVQSLAIASGVFPIWWLARKNWGDQHALWFPVLYLLQPALHFANAEVNYNTYRIEAFLIPTILFGVYFLNQKRWWWAGLCGLMVLFMREDMGVLIASAGLYIALKNKHKLAGAVLAVLGIGYFFLCIKVIIPHFAVNSQYPFVAVFEGLGHSIGEIVSNLITQPQIIWDRLSQPNNLLYISYLLVPLGLVSLGQPSLALTAVPIVAVAMLTQNGVQGSIYFHYHNAPFALLVAAAPAGAAAISTRIAILFQCNSSRAQAVVLTFAMSAALGSTVLGSKIPLSLNFYHPSTSPFHYSVLYVSTPHTKVLEKIKRLIPPDARVSATIFAATHLTHQRDCRLFPDSYEDADYVFVDLNARWMKGAQAELRKWGEDGLPGFDSVCIEDGIFLFKRRSLETAR